jgi:pimeloyl-ACP methyl ester carboxylesterase
MTETPTWFTAAIATPSEVSEVVVDGATIRSRCWGPRGPGIVLIHGGGAHARWWDHVAPLLASEYRVVALDLSGHGDSDRRDAYDLTTWAKEAVVSAPSAGIVGPPVVVGHSMGGWVAFTVGAQFANEVAGVITIDSPIHTLSPEEFAAHERRAFGPLRHYRTAAEAQARFRTVPDDPWIKPYIAEHVAQTSIVHKGEGWTWKFDPRVFDRRRPSSDLLTAIDCRVAVFRAERGLVTSDIGAQMYELLGHVAPVISLPLAGHHAMLDEPISLVVGLRTLLADWRHSEPVAASSARFAPTASGI